MGPEGRITVRKILRHAVLMGVSFAMLSPGLWASGGSAVPRPGGGSSPNIPRKSPQEEAEDHYNAGLKLRDKGLSYEREAAEATTDKEKAKLEKKAKSEFEKSISEFRIATTKNPRFHEAYSDLGFALRKTGDYPTALETYDRALAINPTYTPAIEYRGEAYLALDRLEDGKKAYMTLLPIDRQRADELLKAMKGWVEKRRADPGKLSADEVQEFSKWVDERAGLAAQTPSLSQLQERKW